MKPSVSFVIRPMLLALAAFAASSTAASAALYTFNFAGVVTSKTSTPSDYVAPWNSPAIVVGSSVAINYTIDSTAPDLNGAAILGSYSTVTQVTITIGPVTFTKVFSPSYGGMTVFNNQPAGVDQLEFSNSLASEVSLFFQLDDTTDSSWATDALPLVQLDPANFTIANGRLRTGFFLSVEDINFDLRSIPEPSSLLGLLAGGVLALRRRRC